MTQGLIELNIFSTNQGRLLQGGFDEFSSIPDFLDQIRDILKSESKWINVYLVPKGLIQIPATTKRSQLETILQTEVAQCGIDDFVMPKRNLTLRDIFTDHSEDDLHFVAQDGTISRLAILRTDTHSVTVLKSLDAKQRLNSLTKMIFNKPRAKVKFFKPLIAIPDDMDSAAFDDQANHLPLDAAASLEWIFPWGTGPGQVHLIVEILDTPQDTVDADEHQGTALPLPFIERRRQFFYGNSTKIPSSADDITIFSSKLNYLEQYISCGRPPLPERPAPASLFDETLCEFQHNLNTCTPTRIDIECLRSLRDSLTRSFPSANDRRLELIRLLTEAGICPDSLDRHFIGTCQTDGDMRVIHGLVQFIYYLQVLKNEAGGNGVETYHKAICLWLELARLALTELGEEQEDYINFPAILLEHYGPHITISAATFGEVPNVEALVSVPLHVHSSNHNAILAGERMICALRIALKKLSLYYHSFPLPKRQANYPFRNFYTSNGGVQHYFVYDGAIEDSRLFLAHLSDDPNVRLAVKFSRQYGEAAHRAAAKHGLAPKLYAVEHFYGWFMVVMEDVSASYASLYRPQMWGLPLPPLDDRVRMGVLKAVERLHSEGFVHGDVRDVNLLYEKDSDGVPAILIVDFDWAGPLGEARYPLEMNMSSIKRPPGVELGGEIKPEHDVAMVSYL